jgi:hypothetical protein
MLPVHYAVLTFDIFFIYFPEENEECSSKDDCFSDLKCVEGKCFRETEEKEEKLVDVDVKTSKHTQLFSASTYFNMINILAPEFYI